MSLFGNLIDAGVSYVTNKENLAFQKTALDKNEELTRESWMRDDNAVQRRVADLKAAGLSPVLAAGSAAGNSAPIKATPQESRFQTNFASSSLAQDISAVQQIKANKETNKGLVLANEEQDLKNEGVRLDNKLKELEIAHYGETPTFRLISAIVESLTGSPASEWFKKVGSFLGLRDSNTTGTFVGSQEEASGNSGKVYSGVLPGSEFTEEEVYQIAHNVDSFAMDFFHQPSSGSGPAYYFYDKGNIYISKTGERAIREFLAENNWFMSYEELTNKLREATLSYYNDLIYQPFGVRQ